MCVCFVCGHLSVFNGGTGCWSVRVCVCVCVLVCVMLLYDYLIDFIVRSQFLITITEILTSLILSSIQSNFFCFPFMFIIRITLSLLIKKR